MQTLYLQGIMKKNSDTGYEKTKPKQTQFAKRHEMNATTVLTKDYENQPPWGSKSNQTQFPPGSKSTPTPLQKTGYGNDPQNSEIWNHHDPGPGSPSRCQPLLSYHNARGVLM